MKILVTGSNGLLGQKLSAVLQSQPNIDPIFTARKPLTYPVIKGRFVTLDVCQQDSVQEVIRQSMPNVIIHTAAMTQVDDCETQKEECWKQNVLATGFLVEASGQAGCHFIHISTDFIFDGKTGPLDESAVPNPVNYYGESKLAAETIVRKSISPWAILRTVLVRSEERRVGKECA